MTLFTPARKHQLRARVALIGPTGAGKTWTGLEWAEVLAGPKGRIAVIDTENRSAEFYADRYTFDALPWTPPYDPVKLTATIKYAAGTGPEPGQTHGTITHPYDVIVVDSLTHFWKGEGGTLDVADAAGQRAGGNSFAGWKTATPILRNLLDTIIASPAHIIVTMRSSMEWVIEEYTDRDGRKKTRPQRIGLSPEMRKDVEYEFTIVGELDMEHRLTISKTRCAALTDVVVPKGRSSEPARTFAAWLDTGDTPEPTPAPVPDQPPPEPDTPPLDLPPAAGNGERKPSSAMNKKLFALLKERGIAETERQRWAQTELGLDEPPSFRDLTHDQMKSLIDGLEHTPKVA